jgi:tripartite-type tricarboxylate transporter receptor subunit TctC
MALFSWQRCLAAAVLLLSACGAAIAQNYPAQRVTLVVPFAPGGPTDVISRTVMAEVERMWKQPIVIENRPGAGGLTGSAYVTQQKADGYTWLLQGSGAKTATLFVKQVPFNPADLRVVSALGVSSYVLIAPPELGVKSLGDFIKLAKSKPKALNYGVIPLNVNELDLYLFQRQAGIELTPIPFQSAAPILTALLRNDLQFYMSIVQGALPHIAAGKVVPLAFLGAARHARLPDVPTSREAGVDFVRGVTLGIFVLRGTPDDIVLKMQRDFMSALKSPEVAANLDKIGFEVPPDPTGWARSLDEDMARYAEVVRTLNYQPQ